MATELLEQGPAHRFWDQFAAILVRDRARQIELTDWDTMGMGAEPRVVAPDVLRLHLYPQRPESGYTRAGKVESVVPMLLSFEDGDWWALDLGTEELPDPSWPPVFGPRPGT